MDSDAQPVEAPPVVVPQTIEQSSDVVILDKMPILKSPRKMKARILRTPLDVKFLCRSKLTNKGHGFKAEAYATKLKLMLLQA